MIKIKDSKETKSKFFTLPLLGTITYPIPSRHFLSRWFSFSQGKGEICMYPFPGGYHVLSSHEVKGLAFAARSVCVFFLLCLFVRETPFGGTACWPVHVKNWCWMTRSESLPFLNMSAWRISMPVVFFPFSTIFNYIFKTSKGYTTSQRFVFFCRSCLMMPYDPLAVQKLSLFTYSSSYSLISLYLAFVLEIKIRRVTYRTSGRRSVLIVILWCKNRKIEFFLALLHFRPFFSWKKFELLFSYLRLELLSLRSSFSVWDHSFSSMLNNKQTSYQSKPERKYTSKAPRVLGKKKSGMLHSGGSKTIIETFFWTLRSTSWGCVLPLKPPVISHIFLGNL